MSESQVIARKFRPKTFSQVVGQEAITRTLSNAIKSNTLHHAYLFAGARGVGKTTTARILAKSLNCVNAPTTEPCGECPSCQDIAGSKSMYVAELDAASNTGIDNVREVIIASAAFSPPPGQYRIFIIDEVHQLSTASFNALLKTIEEPPPRVIFIMATTEIQKVPDTILSRCQVFEFRTIQLNKIATELKRIAGELNVSISDSALMMIARAGEGSMRDAESALDQVISFADGAINDQDVSAALGLVSLEVMNSTLRAVADQDSRQLLGIVDDVVSRGLDLRNFCRDLMGYVRSLLVIKAVGTDSELTQLSLQDAQTLEAVAAEFSEADMIRFFSILSKTEQDIRLSSQQRFQLEIGLVKMAQASRLYLIEEALQRLTALEARLSGGEALTPPRVQQSTPTALRANSGSGVGPSPSAGVATPVKAPAANTGPKSSGDSNKSALRPDQRPDTLSQRSGGTEPGVASAPRSGAAPSAASAAPGASSPSYSRNLEGDRHAPPEAPPMMDEPPDEEHFGFAPKAAASSMAGGLDTSHIAEKIKGALEARRKMIIVSTLDQAESIRVEGNRLEVTYSPANAIFKGKLEVRETRAIIEEVCREVAGATLQLSVSVSGAPSAPTSENPSRITAAAIQRPAGQTESAKRPSSIGKAVTAPSTNQVVDNKTDVDHERPENHKDVRALVDKFQGEIIEVIKPKT